MEVDVTLVFGERPNAMLKSTKRLGTTRITVKKVFLEKA